MVLNSVIINFPDNSGFLEKAAWLIPFAILHTIHTIFSAF